jgi:hypothetical protein
MKLFLIAMCIFLAAIIPGHVIADDVTDQINEGLKAYEKKDFGTAVMEAEGLTAFLPAPLSGWEANDADSSSAGSAMFGGGSNASRTYTKETGNGFAEIEISITSDSPMIQSMAMMFSNPMFMGGGNKILIIDGQKTMQNTDDNSLTAMVAGKVMVLVDGNEEVAPQDLKDYLKAVEISKLEEYVK